MTTPFALLSAVQAAVPPAAGAEPAPKPSLLDVSSLLQRLTDWAVAFAPSVVGAVITLIVGVWLAKLVAKGLRGLMARSKVDESLSQFLSGLVYYGLLALVFIAVAGKLGVETTSFVALLGAVGLAVGFALQGSLGNLAAGVMILLFRPFRVGDAIEAAGQAGVVKEIGVFATILATVDNRKVIVPNASITGASIVNATAYETRRVDLVFAIAGDEDLNKARAVLVRAMQADKRVLKTPAPEIVAVATPESGLNLKLMAWVTTADFAVAQAALFEEVKLAFATEGVRGPVPLREIRLLNKM